MQACLSFRARPSIKACPARLQQRTGSIRRPFRPCHPRGLLPCQPSGLSTPLPPSQSGGVKSWSESGGAPTSPWHRQHCPQLAHCPQPSPGSAVSQSYPSVHTGVLAIMGVGCQEGLSQAGRGPGMSRAHGWSHSLTWFPAPVHLSLPTQVPTLSQRCRCYSPTSPHRHGWGKNPRGCCTRAHTHGHTQT